MSTAPADQSDGLSLNSTPNQTSADIPSTPPSTSDDSHAKDLQHISNRPKLKRQQRRTTFSALTASPKKNPDRQMFRRPQSASVEEPSYSSSSPRVQPSTDDLDASQPPTPKGRPAGASRQVLPPIPPGGLKLRRSVSATRRKSGKASDKEQTAPDQQASSLLGVMFTVLGVAVAAAGAFAGGYYYYAQYVAKNEQKVG